jgi:hypothetical protein
VQESTGQPTKQVTNPKNLELQSKIDALEKLLVEYEKELADWEQVDQNHMRSPAAPEVQRSTKAFAGEEEDAELLASMSSLASVPREVLRAIHSARLKVERADQIITQAERETADIVAQYSQQVLGDGVDVPKAVIKSLTMDG